MKEEGSQFPTVRSAFFIILATFFLYAVVEGVCGSFQGKEKILLLESLTIAPALVYIIIKRFSFRDIFRWKTVKGNVLLVSGFIGLGLTVITDELDRLIQMFFPMQENIWKALEGLMIFHSNLELLILVLAVVVVAGFAEEMLFRGFFQSVLERATDVTKAVLVTAFVFTFMHFNPWWFIEILIIGVLLGVLAWRSNSIFPGVVVHGINNGIAIALINTNSSNLGWYLTKGHVSPIWIVLGLALVIGGFRIFYKLTEKDSNTELYG